MFAASVANIKENTLLPAAASPPYSSAIVEQCHIKIMLLIWSPRKIVFGAYEQEAMTCCELIVDCYWY